MKVAMFASLCVAGAAAQAAVTGPIFRVDVEMGGETGFFEVQWDASMGMSWALDQSIDIVGSSGALLGTVESASISLGGRGAGQTVALDFNVAAGAANSVFSISSGLVNFATLSNVFGAASAAVSVTDTTGNGATLSANGPGMYRSQVNGQFPTGTNFATLINSPVVAGAFSTVTFSEDFMGGGFVPIAGSVSDISSSWQVSLSAFDLAAGTSVFTVVPAPGSMLALAAGAALAGRRRR